jgi:glycosyltransferase involved in cell wall biosynthesis
MGKSCPMNGGVNYQIFENIRCISPDSGQSYRTLSFAVVSKHLEYAYSVIPPAMASRTIIIPYFNELERFPISEFFENAAKITSANFILVDDGSTDGLTSLLTQKIHHERLQNFTIIECQQNFGKAHALKTGFKYAIENESKFIGYLDADFSTSLDDLVNLMSILEDTGVDAVIGNRTPTKSNYIHARKYRVFFGRIFSKYVNRYLRINLSDTQCGAKAFKVNHTLLASLTKEIIDPWLYDLQLLLPIIRNGGVIREVPLNAWIHKGGSKFNLYLGLVAVLKIRKFAKLP